MRALRFVAACLFALFSSACLVVSLQPVYEPETIAFDPALVGVWVDTDEGMTVTFERGEWHSYHVTLAQRDDRLRVSARLTRAGERLFLDLSPLDGTDVPLFQLPVHGIYRLELDGDRLSLADLNYELLERKVRAGSAGLPMVIDARRNIVITASTAELRRWLVANAADEDVFASPTLLTRRGAPLDPPPAVPPPQVTPR